MTNNQLKYYLIRAIADTAKIKCHFTVADVWRTLEVQLGPETYRAVRREANDSKLMAACLRKARVERKLIERTGAYAKGDAEAHFGLCVLWRSKVYAQAA